MAQITSTSGEKLYGELPCLVLLSLACHMLLRPLLHLRHLLLSPLLHLPHLVLFSRGHGSLVRLMLLKVRVWRALSVVDVACKYWEDSGCGQ